MRGHYLPLFEVLKQMDKRVSRAIDHFNAGRLRGFSKNFPFMPFAYESLKFLEPDAMDELMSDSSLYIRFTNDMQQFAERAHETFLSFIVPGPGNLNCLERLLDCEGCDEDHWLGFFGEYPEVNQVVVRYADQQSLTLDQSERLYAMSSTLRARGEEETANLMAEKACRKIAERFAISRGEQGGEIMAKAFLCSSNHAELFKEISRFDLLLLVPFIKKDLASNNLPFDTVELVERSLCFLMSNQQNANRKMSIERAVEKLKAAGFGDEVLRRAPSTRREMLCEDLGM